MYKRNETFSLTCQACSHQGCHWHTLAGETPLGRHNCGGQSDDDNEFNYLVGRKVYKPLWVNVTLIIYIIVLYCIRYNSSDHFKVLLGSKQK